MPTPANLIHETSSTTGTGNFTVVSVNGKIRFSDSTYGFGTGGSDAFWYFISNQSAAEWEIGTGSMSDANTLVRDTVLLSSNSNNAVDFSSGTKDVTNDVPAGEQILGPSSSTDGNLASYNGTGGKTLQDSGIAAGDVVIEVATLAALKALTAGSSPVVIMQGYTSAGDGGGGLFRWDSSDLSTEVTADTQNGIYVPPNSDTDGSSGAWVRMVENNIYNPLWFGAAADGSTDDATALQAALDMLSVAGGGILDGNMGDYRLDTRLTPSSRTTIRNFGSIDFTNSSDTRIFETVGTFSTAESLGANLTRGSSKTLSVSDTSSFAVGDYVLVADDQYWDSASTTLTTRAEFGRIVAITTDTSIELREPVQDDYATASNAEVSKVNFVEDVVIENVYGFSDRSTSGEIAVLFDICSGCYVRNCRFDNFRARGVDFRFCINFGITGSTISRLDQSGLAYAIIVERSCRWGHISGNHLSDCRHGVTFTGSIGPNRDVTVEGNHIYGARDAGLDSHAAGDNIVFNANTITCVAAADTLTLGDAMVLQGRNLTATNNKISGATRYGILIQPNVHIDGHIVVSGNTVLGNASDDIGIYVETPNQRQKLTINDNVIRGFDEGIRVETTVARVDYLSIMGNVTDELDEICIRLLTASGVQIRFFSITGNVLRSDSTSVDVISLEGTAANDIQNGVVNSNLTFGGDYGIGITNGLRINVNGNTCASTNTGATDLNGTSVTGSDTVS